MDASTDTRAALRTACAGAAAGLVGSIAMALTLMIHYHAEGFAPTYPLAGIGAVWFGGPHAPHAVLATAGLVTHLGLGIVCGAAFAFLDGNSESFGVALAVGLLYAIALWAIATYLVLPWADPYLYERVAQRDGWWLYSHLAFGAVLVMTPAFAALFRQSDLPLTGEQAAA
jgi:hypothetical protein